MLPRVPRSELTVPRHFPSRPYLHDGELDLLVGLIASVNPETVIEFGVNVGLTAQVLLKYVTSIKHYQGIDVPWGFKTRLTGQQTEVPVNPGFLVQDDDRFELILREEGSTSLKLHDLRPCQAVWIDGDHSYDAVMSDAHLAYHLIQSPGIVVFHDYGNPTVEVTQALDDLAQFDCHSIRHIEGTWLAFENF
jgi:hypothetical protein